MLTQARVVVNGDVVHRAKHTVHEGDEIEVLERQRAEERTPPPASAPTVDLDVLYEDATLLVVNKPHRLLSVATDRLGNRYPSQPMRELSQTRTEGRLVLHCSSP